LALVGVVTLFSTDRHGEEGSRKPRKCDMAKLQHSKA